MAPRPLRHRAIGRTIHSQNSDYSRIFIRRIAGDPPDKSKKAAAAEKIASSLSLTVDLLHIYGSPVAETAYPVGVYPGTFQLDLTTILGAEWGGEPDAYFTYTLIPAESVWTVIGFYTPFQLLPGTQTHTLFVSIPDDEIWPPFDPFETPVQADFSVELVRLSDNAILTSQGPFWLEKVAP